MKIKSLVTQFLILSQLLAYGRFPIFASELATENKNIETVIREHVTIGGKVELQIEGSEDYNNEHDSNVSLSALEFDILVQLVEWGTGKLIFDWDDEKEKMTVDETFLIIGKTIEHPYFMKIGRYDLPFGSYEGNTISDPLTKEAFETKEDALMIGVAFKRLNASTYMFDGETNKDSRNQFGGSVSYGINKDTIRFTGGIDFINSILDGNIFSNNVETGGISGLAGHARFGIDGLAIFAEYITALETIDSYRPSAWQTECSYAFEIMEKETFVSIGYSQTDYLAGLLPKKRIAATTGMEIVDDLTFTVEYTYDKDYGAADNNFSDTVPSGGRETGYTIQLAYEF